MLAAMTLQRGQLVILNDTQRATRARFLAQLCDSTHLDEHVRIDRVTPGIMCPDLFYRLEDHNGGKDPTAPHGADVWYETDPHDPTVQHERRTLDCSGANAWTDGCDRFQPVRMPPEVGYGGYWNTNSKIIDATRILTPKSTPRCYEPIDRPFVGAIVVCPSNSPGHEIGHEERVIAVPAEWAPTERECWALVKTSGSRGSGKKANGPSTAVGWFGPAKVGKTFFLRNVMRL